MPEQWDEDYNDGSLSTEQLERMATERYNRTMQEREAALQARRRSLGYMEMPKRSHTEIFDEFPLYNTGDHRDYLDSDWNVHRLFLVCHSCGNAAFKRNIKETTKCTMYYCRSRNVSILRMDEVSTLIKNNMRLGMKMPEVFAARQERMRLARRQRSNERATRRMNAQIGAING